MKIYKIDFQRVADTIKEIEQTKQEGLIVEIATHPWLATGKIDGTYSEAVRQELGIPLFQSKHYGGTCVVFPGDLSLCEFKLGKSDFGKLAICAIRDYLLSVGFNVSLDGNDLMLCSIEECDKFKVASYGSGSFGDGYMQTVVHVSIGMDENLIKKICLKEQKKRPRGLSKYGITAQDIYDAIKHIFV